MLNFQWSHLGSFLSGAIITLVPTLFLAHPPLRTWLLNRVRQVSSDGKDLLIRAVPDEADDLVVAGWAFATGAFFNYILSNIGPILVGNNPLPFLLLFAAVIIPLTLYLFYIHRRTLPLSMPWPFITWLHYRPLVVKLSSIARPTGRIDFVSHRGVDLEMRIAHDIRLDLRYGLCSSTDTVAAIIDYEALTTLDRCSLIGKDIKRVPLTRSKRLTSKVTRICRSFPIIHLIEEDNPTFLPLRWGFNTISIRVRNEALANKIHNEFFDNPIDLYEFFTSQEHPLRELLSKHDQKCPLFAFDWHLPVMMLLVQSACGNSAWNSADISPYSARIGRLLDAVGSWLSENMIESEVYGISPLIEDVMQMQNILKTQDLCVVLGGGNFLWSSLNKLTPENVICLPVKREQSGYCLLWCEVLAIFASSQILSPDNPKFDGLMSDSDRLIQKVINSIEWTQKHHSFHGYTQKDKLRTGTIEKQWHDFASKKGQIRSSNLQSMNQWVEEWNKVRERLRTQGHSEKRYR